MNIALWVIAGILAAAFLAAGAMKITTPRAKLEPNMSWVTHATDGQVKLLGLLEVLGAIGLILPAALDIAPMMVPIAAACLAITMAGAAVVHAKLSDPAPAMLPSIVLGALCVFVAVMRFGPQAF